MKNIFYTGRAFILLILLLTFVSWAHAQMVWPAGPMMVNAKVNAAGDLEITPSATSSAHDFDYLAGKWTMDNKRLKTRLNGCTEWISYPSTDENSGPILNGIGNTDIFKTAFNQVKNTLYEGLTVRLFNPKTKLWSIYWVDSNLGKMDPPVVGSFEGNVGRFYCKDVFNGKPILVMFVWDKTDPDNPIWYQAFSPDNGVSWEWNMTNVSHKVK
jgi:hypothetical protein